MTGQTPAAGRCRCEHDQAAHKGGRGGCREFDCDCARYTAPKASPVPAVAELAGQVAQLCADLAEEQREHRATGALQRAAEQRVDELTATVDRLRIELDRANAARQLAQDALDDATRTGPAVLWQYDADQCEKCGRRYTVPADDHPHPLTPVTVLVVRRPVTANHPPAPAGTNPEESP